MIKKKKCGKCGRRKLLKKFSKNKNKKDGLHFLCKECAVEYARQYRKDNPEKCKAQCKGWRLTNPKKYQASYAKYYKENLDKIKISQAKCYQKNRDKICARQKEYCATINGYLHRKWHDMKDRCENPKNNSYEWYGAKGIIVEWPDFNAFKVFVDLLGIDIRGLEIHRTKPEGNYSSTNVEFLTPKQHRLAHKKLQAASKK